MRTNILGGQQAIASVPHVSGEIETFNRELNLAIERLAETTNRLGEALGTVLKMDQPAAPTDPTPKPRDPDSTLGRALYSAGQNVNDVTARLENILDRLCL